MLLPKLFIKNYRNTSDTRVRKAYGVLASVVGVIVNLLLFAAKFFIGTLAGSVAIRADAINNLSDAGSQVISFISFKISSKPADRKHPHGHARIEYVASMIVSFLILHIGLDLLLESVDKILHPALPSPNYLTIGILGGSVLLKLWLGIFNLRMGRKIDSSVMRATAMDSFSDTLSTSAVLVASLIPLVFPSVTLNLDAYMGVIVAILILIAGIKILLEAKDSILGEAPSEEMIRQITEVVGQYPEAVGIHDLEIHNYGPGHTVAALHVEVDGKADVFHSHDVIDNIEKRLRMECGIQATIHMDPIVTDDDTVTAARTMIRDVVSKIDPEMDVHDFRLVSGPTHTNLIFDVCARFENRMSDEEIKRVIADCVSKIDPSYFVVVTVDRS